MSKFWRARARPIAPSVPGSLLTGSVCRYRRESAALAWPAPPVLHPIGWVSATTALRECVDGSPELAREHRPRRDHDPQPPAFGVIEAVHARKVGFSLPGVQARHDEHRDAVAILRTDR